MATKPLDVFIETGSSKVFASAADWPGWARAAKNEEAALEALANYAPRYEVVAEAAGMKFPAHIADTLNVVERTKGGATTDFGAPEITMKWETQKVTPAAAKRLGALVNAAWTVFAEIAAVTPEELRKGPRGGGRDRDKMIDHVYGAEVAYARKLGLKFKQPTIDDHESLEAVHTAILAVIAAASDGSPVVERGWTTAYAARRIAWHVLDHAWEMQDRST